MFQINSRTARVVVLLSFTFPLMAEEAADKKPEPEGWQGAVETGVIATSGNTDTSSSQAKGEFTYQTGPWREGIKLEAMKSTDGDMTTAERYLASNKLDYRFGKKSYVFGLLRYEKDHFSAYDYRFSETVGYGRKVLEREKLSLELEGGVGGRHQKPDSSGPREDDAIVQASGKLRWGLGETSEFAQDLLVQSGGDNTYTESVSALKAKINHHLAMKLSYSYRHNSQVPAGTAHGDASTAVTLVYDF